MFDGDDALGRQLLDFLRPALFPVLDVGVHAYAEGAALVGGMLADWDFWGKREREGRDGYVR